MGSYIEYTHVIPEKEKSDIEATLTLIYIATRRQP